MDDAREMLELLQASSCFADGAVCHSLPCACAETLARTASERLAATARPSVNEYVADYEFRGDQDYTPTDGERTMIEDAIEGYLASVPERLAAGTGEREKIKRILFSYHGSSLSADEAVDAILALPPQEPAQPMAVPSTIQRRPDETGDEYETRTGKLVMGTPVSSTTLCGGEK